MHRQRGPAASAGPLSSCVAETDVLDDRAIVPEHESDVRHDELHPDRRGSNIRAVLSRHLMRLIVESPFSPDSAGENAQHIE
jgi:hypothetical protein